MRREPRCERVADWDDTLARGLRLGGPDDDAALGHAHVAPFESLDLGRTEPAKAPMA